MQRRKFIIKTILGIPTLMMVSLSTSCPANDEDLSPIDSDKKVVIIGAGISGLAAAKYFKTRNVNVVVLEAQEKVGGRLRTNRSLGVAFDEGASWIHGPEGNPITALATMSGADTFLTNDDSVAVFDINGIPYTEEALTTAENELEAILEGLEGEAGESFKTAFYARYPQYQNNRLWTYMLSAFLEFDTGGDISRLSSLDFYDDEAFNGADLIITNGYDRVADFLAEGLDIRLNTKVEGIDYTEETIRITTDQAGFDADFVLVTVPLGVLKRNVISFTPALPTRIQGPIDRLEMGSVNKFLCVWDTPFWDNDLQYIGYTPEEKGKFNYFLNVGKFADTNALMTFAYGDYSRLTESMSDTEVIDEIMSHLQSIYGADIPAPVSMLRTRWSEHEFSFGAYSFIAKAARSSDFEAFEEAVNEKLFFAGEHTNRDYRGTVHGAYLSGIREAVKIADLL